MVSWNMPTYGSSGGDQKGLVQQGQGGGYPGGAAYGGAGYGTGSAGGYGGASGYGNTGTDDKKKSSNNKNLAMGAGKFRPLPSGQYF